VFETRDVDCELSSMLIYTFILTCPQLHAIPKVRRRVRVRARLPPESGLGLGPGLESALWLGLAAPVTRTNEAVDK